MNGNDLLPGWRDGAAKTAILDFAESVTGPDFCRCEGGEVA
jgi:hypothetical protein